MSYTVHGVVGDAHVHMAKVRLWIHAVEFGRSDQAVHCNGPFAARIRACMQPIFSTQRHGSDFAFGGIVVNLDTR